LHANFLSYSEHILVCTVHANSENTIRLCLKFCLIKQLQFAFSFKRYSPYNILKHDSFPKIMVTLWCTLNGNIESTILIDINFVQDTLVFLFMHQLHGRRYSPFQIPKIRLLHGNFQKILIPLRARSDEKLETTIFITVNWIGILS
jgi:hypothetical protein